MTCRTLSDQVPSHDGRDGRCCVIEAFCRDAEQRIALNQYRNEQAVVQYGNCPIVFFFKATVSLVFIVSSVVTTRCLSRTSLIVRAVPVKAPRTF